MLSLPLTIKEIYESVSKKASDAMESSFLLIKTQLVHLS